MAKGLLWLGCLLAMLLCVVDTRAEPQGERAVRVGVVVDGPSERYAELEQLFRTEITRLLSAEFHPRFAPEKRLVADYSVAGVQERLNTLLDDPEVDVVIALGVVASSTALKRADLKKPVLAPFTLGGAASAASGGKSSPSKNLSYIVWQLNLERDLRALAEIGRFRRVAILVSRATLAAIPDLDKRLVGGARRVGVEAVIVPVGLDVTAALQAMPAVDAVYVGANPQLGWAQIDKLAKALLERRLPSFSWLGRAEVERGLLAGLGDPEDLTRLARRVALNLQSLLLGEPPERRGTAFKTGEQLVLNMATARVIGTLPNWSVITDAVLLNEKRDHVKRKLTLAGAVREALTVNLDLAAGVQRVRVGSTDVRSARANLLPSLAVSASFSWIDADRTGLGNAERTLSWSAELTQSLYSERAWTNYSIQKDLQRGREQELQSLRLDTAFAAAIAYLGVLKTQTFERIQRENLALTRDNLAQARVRQQIGSAGPAEVFRWETAIAQSRRDLIDTVAVRNRAEIELNRQLNRPLEEPFTTEEASLDDPTLIASEQSFRDYLENPLRFKALRDFIVREGLLASPELGQIDSSLAAEERRLAGARRELFVPSIGVRAGTTHRILEGGAGSEEVTLPAPFDSALSVPDNLDWFVGVSANLPLYEGGSRYAAIDRSRLQQGELRLVRRALAQRLEQRIRSALHAAGSSFPAIRLTRDAAKAARDNLAMVRDAYSRGTTGIVTLLDAQNQALVADLAAANATHDFLLDLMELERASGSFDFFRTASERRAFFRRLDAFAARKSQARGSSP